MSDRLLRQSEVTTALTAWAVRIEDDPRKRVVGYEERRTFDGRAYAAKVEWHNYIGRTGQTGVRIPGTTLYVVDGQPPAAPHDADFSPTTELAKGVDVSSYQPTVAWGSLAGAGYSFVYAKATEGLTGTDRAYPAHRSGAKAAGLLRGAYHFLRTTDPTAQARRFWEAIHADGLELPPALDVEWQQVAIPLGGLDPGHFADIAVEAVDELARLCGRRPITYTAPGFWSLLPAAQRREIAARSDLWLAHYTSGAPTVPTEWGSWTFWQHTDKASAAGYPGYADANRFCGTKAQLALYAAGKWHDQPLDLSTLRGLQLALNRLGAKLVVDGLPGPQTDAAVRAFQASHGLKVDALPGPATRLALKLALAAL